MSNAIITVRYDGPALADHRMDVADLAPALLGISNLCEVANRKFNGDQAAIKVLIATDHEHQCFQFDLNIVQTLWQQAQNILSNHEIRTAKEILEWLGLTTGTSIVGLFGLLRLRGTREIAGTKFDIKDGHDVVQIHIEGDNNSIAVYPEALKLMRDADAMSDAKRVVEPLTKEGYERIEFEIGRGNVIERISKAEAEAIYESTPLSAEEIESEPPQLITAWIQVYAPVYEPAASRWQFRFGDRHESMDISETDIARKAMERGGALIDDTYKAILEIQQTKTESGRFKTKYKIKKVLEFHPATIRSQADWIEGTGNW